jgi:hypothetical protein
MRIARSLGSAVQWQHRIRSPLKPVQRTWHRMRKECFKFRVIPRRPGYPVAIPQIDAYRWRQSPCSFACKIPQVQFGGISLSSTRGEPPAVLTNSDVPNRMLLIAKLGLQHVTRSAFVN